MTINNCKTGVVNPFGINMIDEMNKRIIDLMVRLDLNKASFARELDVSLPLMTHITSGRNKPGLELLQRILTRFEDINPDWLLLGTGSMYREKAQKIDIEPLLKELNALGDELLRVKQAQQSVIQYHTLFKEEMRHLDELDIQLQSETDRIKGLQERLERMKHLLQSI